MVRRGLVACVIGAIQLAALQGLFLHVHPDDHDTPHHRGRTVHAHLTEHSHPSFHPIAGKGIGEADDDRSFAMAAFIAVPAADTDSPGPPEYGTTPAPEAASAIRRPPLVSHTHGPPFITSHASRPPPACVRLA